MVEEKSHDNVRFAASSAYGHEQEKDSPLSEMLNRVPSYISRGLLYLTVLFLAVVISWAAVNKIDVVVSVPAEIIPEGQLKTIQPNDDGVVREILARAGDVVKKGTPLAVLESSNVGKLLTDLAAKRRELELATKEVNILVPAKVAQLNRKITALKHQIKLHDAIHQNTISKLDEQLRRYQVGLKNTESRVKLTARIVRVNSKLNKTGIVADRKLLEFQQLHMETQSNIHTLSSKIRETKIDKSVKAREVALNQQELETQISDLHQEAHEVSETAGKLLEKASIQYESAQSLASLNLRGVREDAVKFALGGKIAVTNRAILRAPVDGTIAELKIHTLGQTVKRGETLLTLVPKGVDLIAVIRVPNKDIGKIALDREIRFKFDAFPFEEYGVLIGAVENLSPSTIKDEKDETDYYRGTSRLNQDYFRVAGRKVKVLPGMTAVAEIKTDRRSVLALIFQPLAKLRTPQDAEE